MILKHNNFSYEQIDVLINDTEGPYDLFDNYGVVISAFGDRNSLIYYDRKTVTQFFYNGDMHPIYGTDFCEEMNSPLAVGFIIADKEKGMILLDRRCNPIRIDDPAWIKIKSQVEVYRRNTHCITEYPFSSNTFCCKNIIEALFGNKNEFLERI
ncbi:MAG: hypothetical protein ACI4SF_05160 [Oscillospiraceae bacterium]